MTAPPGTWRARPNPAGDLPRVAVAPSWPNTPRATPPLPSEVAQAAQPLPQPRPAIERVPEVHLHLHGLSPAEIAAIIKHAQGPE